MKIKDINGKERDAASVKQVFQKSIDTNGNEVYEPFAEVGIIGTRSHWIEWYPWEKFITDNPDIPR